MHREVAQQPKLGDLQMCTRQGCHGSRQLTIFGIETIEDVDKQLVNDVHDLIIVLIDGHFEIQASELTQVTVREGVLCPATSHMLSEKKIKAKPTPFGVDVTRSLVIYQAAQKPHAVTACGQEPTSQLARREAHSSESITHELAALIALQSGRNDTLFSVRPSWCSSTLTTPCITHHNCSSYRRDSSRTRHLDTLQSDLKAFSADLTPEDWANLKDLFLVCHDGHLLVQLG